MNKTENLIVGIISDGKYGERAFQNIKEIFNTKWILVPDIPSNVLIEEDLNIDIAECDLYISYVRHPDIILQIAELQKPLILGVLPGVGLYLQLKRINNKVVHAPTMCSLENNTKIPEIDIFTTYFGKPIFDVKIDKYGFFTELFIKRGSLCGSSNAGAKFLLNKEFNKKNLQDFALRVCHECRAPRFGYTCDKEVAGINHLVSLLDNCSAEIFERMDDQMKLFIKNIREEYSTRMENSRKLLNQVV